MIYWINGSYAVGKTTIAEALVKKLKKAYVIKKRGCTQYAASMIF